MYIAVTKVEDKDAMDSLGATLLYTGDKFLVWSYVGSHDDIESRGIAVKGSVLIQDY